MVLHWFEEYVTQFLSLGGLFFLGGRGGEFSYPVVSQEIDFLWIISCCYSFACMWFIPAASARPKKTK